MASAGRILIMPKGNYDSSVTYEMLDLVFYNSTSWVVKKTVVGIEPSEENSEYWHKLCESTDLTDVENRIKILEEKEETLGIEVAALKETMDEISDSIGNFSNRNVLDYDNLVTINHTALPYTCPSAGEVIVCIKISGEGGTLKIDKNNIPASYLVGHTSDESDAASTFPVAKNDIITRNSEAVNIETGTITFVPYKYQ